MLSRLFKLERKYKQCDPPLLIFIRYFSKQVEAICNADIIGSLLTISFHNRQAVINMICLDIYGSDNISDQTRYFLNLNTADNNENLGFFLKILWIQHRNV
jgi:hypothetical protein